MIKNPYPGLFIAFEGLDGAGSSTQAEMLQQNLSTMGLKVLLTKEPTNNIIGGIIRGQLTKDWSSNMECLQFLFAADRAHHLEREIIPALKQKGIVVSDRYAFSTIAYGALELDKNWLITLNERFILPDLTFILRVSPKTCLKRIKDNRFDLELFEEEKKLKKVWTVYLWLSKKFPNVQIIDGEKTRGQIAGQVLEITKKYLKKKKIKGGFFIP